MGCEAEKLVVGCGPGSPMDKLLDCALLTLVGNGRTQGLVAGDILDCGVGNAEDMCLDSLEEHILPQVDRSKRPEDCTKAEEHVVAHSHESVEALWGVTAVILAELSSTILSEP